MSDWNTDEIVPGNVIRAADMIAAMNDAQGDIKLNGNGLLDVGQVELTEVSAPTTPASNKAVVYVDSTSGQLCLKKDTGTVVNLETSPVTSVFGRTGAVVAVEGDYSLDKLSDVSLATPSANDVLMFGGSTWGAGALGNSSLLDTGTTTGTVAVGDDARFVTNGNGHDHNGGDGGTISHLNLSNIGTNSHATIDTRLAALGNSSTLDIGTTSSTVAAGDDSRFVTNGNSHDHNGGDGGTISHLNLSNIGTNSHATIDTHLASTSNPHSVTATQVGLGSVPNYPVCTQAEAEAGTATNKLMTPQRTLQAIVSLAGIINQLDAIPDVDVATVQGGDVLTYDSNNLLWTNVAPPTTGTFTTGLALGSTPAGAGRVKMSNGDAFTSRNFANSADIGVLGTTSANLVRLGYSGASGVTIGAGTTVAGMVTSTVVNGDSGISHEATTAGQMGIKIVRTDGTYGVTTYLYAPGNTTDFRINHGGSDRITIKSAGRVMVGTTTDDGANALQVNGQIKTTTKTPSSASDTGVTGTMCWDASYVYVCTATNTWKRSAIATW